jgi:hypothetical protein
VDGVNTKRVLLLIWLAVSQLVFVFSLAFWYMAWVFATEMKLSFLYFVSSYPVFIIVSAVMSWIGFARKNMADHFFGAYFLLFFSSS